MQNAQITNPEQHSGNDRTRYVVDVAAILGSIAAFYGRQDLTAQDILDASAADVSATTKGVR